MNTAGTIRLEWAGLEELRVALRRLPRELADRAGGSVRQAAYRAAARISAAYPVSGRTKKGGGGVRLASGVKVIEELSTYGVSATVRSTAKHAHLWEWGTGDRANRYGNRGAMIPANYGAPVFVPIVEEERARMVAEFVDILRTAGVELEVELTAA